MTQRPIARRAVRRSALLTISAVGLALFAQAAPAAAVASDATTGCGATKNKDGLSASVPTNVWFRDFKKLVTNRGTWPIKCGNGQQVDGFGAVHIELKHKVPNWPDALNCMKKVIEKADEVDRDKPNNKIEFIRTVPGSRLLTKVHVIVGPDGVVTAFPEGSNEEAKWRDCSLYA